ncbi:zinc-binding alcohol dehydrogenase [Natronosporangium hydrolyticum]|uniref:Zinc-binding alcohol dehydrogenase n=1 Tax=Natronosporangium hydrolyticum TaxID=2811111 RepID=A0A895YB04_9ACTN|nr:zinc-binding alcohol dehydrogenase [Natronosporangium hydrolyticum]QSB12653.1 zinc-binding alcohol dehydrogenase [Natronosporangium hydrolyticum]
MGSPVGLHRVVEPPGVLPQAAWRLDPDPTIRDDEVRVSVHRLNLDAASFRQLREAHGGDGDAVRAQVRQWITERGKMHNPVTGSGGMLIGTVDAVGPASPLGLRAGDQIATLVSLSLTPLAISDDLADWDGRSEQVPCAGHAILFARSAVAVLPDDLDPTLALAVLDVCGAPALTDRLVRQYAAPRPDASIMGFGTGIGADEVPKSMIGRGGGGPAVAVLGAAGKSGALALAAARRAGAAATVGLVPTVAEQRRLTAAGLADAVVLADARDPVATAEAVTGALAGAGADITVVCVDASGCEHGAILATASGGTVIFFGMATSFTAAALGAEGLAADVTMLIGNGFVPGHADHALALLRSEPGARELIEARIRAD